MDLCLYGHNNGVPTDRIAAATGLSPDQVERVIRDIEQKRRTTAYLHRPPVLMSPVPQIQV
jgi:NAD+ synthase